MGDADGRDNDKIYVGANAGQQRQQLEMPAPEAVIEMRTFLFSNLAVHKQFEDP